MQHLTSEQNNNTSEWEEPITNQTEQLQDEAEGEEREQEQAVYHVYIVKEPETDEEIPPFVDETASAPNPKRHSGVFVFMCCISLVAILSGFATGVLLFTPTVTVTIVPEQKNLTTTTTITLVSGKPQTAEEIPGRLLPALTMSQQQTVKTTGKGYQEATFASGTVTFYNAAPYSQFIPAGTLLIAQSGNQVVTDQDATLPAADMPIVGQVSVSAHAVVAGSEGNMPKGSIDSACCRLNVFVTNTTSFTGGQHARSFPMVTKQDIESTAATLKASLLQSMHAALQTQVKADETLVTPISCKPIVTPSVPVGAEATELTVTVSQTCTAAVYGTAALQSHIQAIQTQESKQFGTGYVLKDLIETTITKVSETKHGLLQLSIAATGIWVYQFTNQQVELIKSQIAGKSKEQATKILLQAPGVKQVSVADTAALPTDPGKIEIVVMTTAVS